MKTLITIAFSITLNLFAFLTPLKVSAGLIYPYYKLAMMDLEQVNTLLQNKITESRNTSGDKWVPLKEAYQAVFSRPNADNLIVKIISPLDQELKLFAKKNEIVEELISEATQAIKQHKNFKPEAQVSYHIFLDNWMSESKPYANNPDILKLFKKISEQDLPPSKEALIEARNRIGYPLSDPSKTAQKILSQLPPPPPPVSQMTPANNKAKLISPQAAPLSPPTPTVTPNLPSSSAPASSDLSEIDTSESETDIEDGDDSK